MSDYAYCVEDCQEFFSEAYIAAIAAVAGYGFDFERIDRNSIDVRISQRIDRDPCPDIDELKIQLKCTYAHRPKKGVLKYPLKIKNYNDLRPPNLVVPRILVVVYIPKPPQTNWLEHNIDHLLLRHEAFWTSLKGKPETTNNDSITVELHHKFTTENLIYLMNEIASGNRP